MWGIFERKARRNGILGINCRNADYILTLNQRCLYPLVDDKLKTKELAQKAGIAVPELYGLFRSVADLRKLEEIVKPYSDFVIKPAHGCGGEGILVIDSREEGRFFRVNGTELQLAELQHHVANVLYGLYSLGGQCDQAMIEYRVKFDPVFSGMGLHGVPDIRIIVFYGVPVMAMLRLPTETSNGRANLHQGAVGVGIDLCSGQTVAGVWNNKRIEKHPDTGVSILGLEIPQWERLLDLASRCHELSGLVYQGVDIVLDRDLGPLILELNARPGLAIQIANGAGLIPRLKIIEERHQSLQSVEDKVAFACQEFG